MNYSHPSTLLPFFFLTSKQAISFYLKIQLCDYLTKKYTSISWKKNSHDRILRREPKEQHINTVPKSYSNYIIRSSKASMFRVFLLYFFKQIFINNRKQLQHHNKKQNPPRYCCQLRMIIKNFLDILYYFHVIFVCTDFKTLPLSFHIWYLCVLVQDLACITRWTEDRPT